MKSKKCEQNLNQKKFKPHYNYALTFLTIYIHLTYIYIYLGSCSNLVNYCITVILSV